MKPSLRALPARAASRLQEFLRLEAAAGIVLTCAAALALACANSPLGERYSELLEFRLVLGAGALQIAKPLLLWINDGLMAVFFLLVALEIKREMRRGELATRAQRALPLICAGGGLVVPAAIYAAFNHGDPGAMRGWAIPTATDIAFALGALALLGSRVPLALKVLLSAIAVIDDLAAIVIIAVFYAADLSLSALAGAAVSLALMWLLGRLGVRRILPFLLLGIVMWVFVLKSGVHATVAGVATGLMMPLGDEDDESTSPLETLEHALHPWVAFLILPLFAFANAGLDLRGMDGADVLHPVPMGIALGLLLGKPLGVFAAAWLSVRLRIAIAPQTHGWSAVLGMAILCGIGFTMSLFIGSLAFGGGDLAQAEGSRLGILIGSIASALAGLSLLHLALPRTRIDA
jgi:Na+:H+ antiporter, NhaA family